MLYSKSHFKRQINVCRNQHVIVLHIKRVGKSGDCTAQAELKAFAVK